MATRKYVLVLAAVGVLAAGGCTSDPTPPVAGSQGASPSGTASASAATTPAMTAPAPAPKTVAPSGSPVKGCTTEQVNVIVGQSSGAAGTLVQEMDVHNTSAVTCTLTGRPFVSVYGKVPQGGGTVEATLGGVAVGQIPSTFGQLGAPATPQNLTHGDYAVFFLKWSQVPVGSKPCDKADGYAFRTPADASVNHLVTFAFTVCGGEVQVSNFMPKSSGF
ncbi:DUF4232 domain-containing protein [Longispora sp. K20-0274]|uniref:DUF4232 domain-containing protein n=1 Tax=Longispora sp. K20-0274 TaxID=3088255 RepID=UPI003999769C